jgi:hypothetical protein
VETERREKADDTVGDTDSSLRERVMLGDPRVGPCVEATANPFDLTCVRKSCKSDPRDACVARPEGPARKAEGIGTIRLHITISTGVL